MIPIKTPNKENNYEKIWSQTARMTDILILHSVEKNKFKVTSLDFTKMSNVDTKIKKA